MCLHPNTDKVLQHTIKEKGSNISLKTSLYRFAVIGGDLRQVYLAEILKNRGYEITGYALCTGGRNLNIASSLKEALENADIIAAPMPFMKSGRIQGSGEFPDLTMENIVSFAHKGSYFFAGGIPEKLKKQAAEKIACVDYLKDEEVAVQNTVAAAEGMIAEAITRSPRNLYRSECLVAGYGKCGSTLVSYLKKFACKVTVYEKEKAAAARAQIAADRVIDSSELPQCLNTVSYIFNTAPSRVLPKAMLGYVRKDVLILDLASAPGGVDYEAAKEMGIQAVLLLGLPGKYAPLSSAEILAEAVIRNITAKEEKERKSICFGGERLWN